MPGAVVFGAGNIGRGFLGQIFAESGWSLVFLEADQQLVAALNASGRYPIQIVSNEAATEFIVEPVRAVSVREEAAVHELAEADMAATAVGVNVLAGVAPVIARALLLRASLRPGDPLDIIVCENLIGADRFLRAEVAKNLPDDGAAVLAGLGLVEASIGRMVPFVTPERRAADPLRVWVEPYCELPVDAAGFRGTPPNLAHLKPFKPFSYYIERKLYLHNAGHALAAYLGYLAGCTFVWEAMENSSIHAEIERAMAENSRALSLEHGIALAETLAHAKDLQSRFANRALGDTIARVGRDPLRKLGPEDRLIGAARLVMKHGGKPDGMAKGIAAALRFTCPDDEGAARVQEWLRTAGLAGTLHEVCGLEAGDALAESVRNYYMSHKHSDLRR